MSRWSNRHRAAIADALGPGETLLAAERVVINAVQSDATDRVARGGRGKRVDAARDRGFPVPGPIFVLALTDQRLLLFNASTWLSRPRDIGGEIDLDDVATIRAARRLLAERLAILLESRSMLVVQPLWGRGLRDFDRAFTNAKGR